MPIRIYLYVPSNPLSRKFSHVPEDPNPPLDMNLKQLKSGRVLSTRRKKHWFFKREFGNKVCSSPSKDARTYKFGSSINSLIFFSRVYSAFPPSVVQKESGSLPSLTSTACHVGCIQHQKKSADDQKSNKMSHAAGK